MLPLPRFPLSLALAGLSAPAGLREQVEWAAQLGYRAVQLNGGASGTRARELSRTGRRDVAALLRRHEMACSGVDLWIPAAHFIDPAHSDRAAEAVGESLLLAADIASLTSGRAVLCIATPSEPAAGGVIAALSERARTAGAILADSSWPQRWTSLGMAACIDPATILISGETSISPAKALALAGPAAANVRLSDLGPSGRVEPGTGRLDLLAYLVAASTVSGGVTPVVDLRGIADQPTVAAAVQGRCGLIRIT
ncbi:MAG: hypothetical protein JNK58_12960 [Phycisphaerae bacterium]|nr:hypothetical protein [Phycisphaerae bacterium]